MKSAGKARNNGLYRHIRTSKEIIRNLLNDSMKKYMTKDNNTSTRYAPNAFSAHLIFKQPIITDTAIPSVIIKDTNKTI